MTSTPERTPSTVLACPDAFKQTASAAVIAAAIGAAAHAAGWVCDRCPLSDGGEGFARVLAEAGETGAEEMVTRVTGPLGVPVDARWYRAGDIAMIESAAASGLGLAGGAEGNDPVAASTRGTGELVAAALSMGARTIYVGVGGSATTDGGLGAVEAIEDSGGPGGAELVVACDVETLFVDAAAVFGPQKGATPEQVVLLRQRLGNVAERYRARYGVDVTTVVGSGAAGGLAGGLAALGAHLAPGFDAVAAAVDLDARLARSSLVITGEGRFDATSWAGKVVGGVVERAARAGVAVIVVAGSVSDDAAVSAPVTPIALQVVSLTDRFGSDRAMADPGACVEMVVRDLLDQKGLDS